MPMPPAQLKVEAKICKLRGGNIAVAKRKGRRTGELSTGCHLTESVSALMMEEHWDFFCIIIIIFLRNRVYLYSPGCPGAHSVEQAGLELRNPPASASQSAGITG